MLKSKFTRLRGPALNENLLELNGSPVMLADQSAQVQTKPASHEPKTKLILISPVIVSVLLSIVGQLILKRGMSDLGPVSFDRGIFNIIWQIATDPFVIVGAIIFAGSVLFWLVGLSRVPLSYAYPFISLSYVAILAASVFLLGESVSLLRLGGVGVICLGVILVASS